MALSESIDLVDIDSFIATPGPSDECNRIAASLKHFGAVLIRDARVRDQDCSEFINLMERYFEQPTKTKMKDVRAKLSYQVRQRNST